MFKIQNNKKAFYQWDTNQQILVTVDCSEVHFTNDDEKALVVEVRELLGHKYVTVPNILLQEAKCITAYAYEGHTKYQKTFRVIARAKPDDYVYTETEVLSYKEISDRQKALEAEHNALKEITSQGRSANITMTKPGWKRVLNVIRAHGGSLCLGLGKANLNYGYAFQVLGLEFTGNVNFPGTTTKPISLDTEPIIYQKFNHLMGENNGTDASRKAMITKVRIGYPKRDYKTSPVNCYVDVYVEFMQRMGTPALLVNYAGFADSHNCVPITEETEAADVGMYGEELDFYEFEPNADHILHIPNGSVLFNEILGNNAIIDGVLQVGDVTAYEVAATQMYADNMPYERLIGTEESPIILRDLQDGIYYLSGKFLHYATDTIRTLIDGLYVVNRKTTDSVIVRLSPRDTNIRYYTITDKSYKATQMSHADIVELQEKVATLENRVQALEEA